MSDNLLNQIIKDIQNKTLAQFQLKHIGWYLYGYPVDEGSGGITYKTDVIDSGTLQQLVAKSQATGRFKFNSEAADERFVFEIRKKKENAWAEWITIGRAVNNDVVLRYPTVSKLHARFEVETTAFGDPIGYKLVDNNSTGGTVVNGTALAANQPVPANVGDAILLGNVKCIILDATMIWKKLR